VIDAWLDNSEKRIQSFVREVTFMTSSTKKPEQETLSILVAFLNSPIAAAAVSTVEDRLHVH